MKRRSRKSFPNILMLCFVVLVVSFTLTLANGQNPLSTILSSLGQNEKFVTNALALQFKIFPQNIPMHNPSHLNDFVAQSSNSSIENQISYYSESHFTPSKQISAIPKNALPITELTIKANDNSHYKNSGNVYIQNQTDFDVDVASFLKNPKIITTNTNGKPTVMLLHTHTTEAYTPDDKNYYTPDDTDRSMDPNFNVVRIGDEIEKILTDMGINVIHCREILDHPSYKGSYDKAMAAIQAQIKKTPEIKVIIDIHRDAMINDKGVKYKTVTDVNGEQGAQLMLVMGTNAGGLTHDNWRTNLNYAVNLQSKIEAEYPNLMRPINLRKQRFNENVREGSMLLEVGTCGNTVDEALISARAFAKVLGNNLLSGT